ncbi:MAG: hypothetical protein AAGJ97_08465 [Planctomycetota bacterium]
MTLAVFVGSAAAAWLFLFPRLASIGPIRDRIDRLEAASIDGDALVVTDLDERLRADVKRRLAAD